MSDVLQRRLQQGEDLHTEFKETLPQAGDLASEILAFANTDGGVLIIGVRDDGQIVGVSEPARLAQTVDNVCFQDCEPRVTELQKTVQVQSRQVLVVHVPQGAQRPYRTQRGQYDVRSSTGKRRASREVLLRIFQAGASPYYDETPLVRSSPEVVDDTAVSTLLQLAQEHGIFVAGVPPERLLRNWKLLTDVNGKSHLTVAGALFVANDPQRLVSCACISALRIPGNDITIALSDQKQIKGRLQDQIASAFQFLEMHLTFAYVFEGIQPERRPEMHFRVLRTAIVNALAHRDYTVASPVRLIVYTDWVEVRTPGLLLNTVTLEDLRYGIHVLRNPAIYSMFLRLGQVTDAGSGIARMIRLMDQHVGQEPDFALEGREFVVRLPRSVR